MRKRSQRADHQKVQSALVEVPSLKERKARAVREAIWSAAMELFAANGYDDTTVENIAQAAGISLRSFFRYFMSKGDLMSFALLLYGEQLAAAVDGCPDGYSVREVFRESVVAVANAGLSNEARTRKHLKILKLSPAAASAEMLRLQEVQAHVAKAYQRRLPEAPESAVTAAAIAGVSIHLTGVVVRWCLERGEADASSAIGRVLGGLEGIFCRGKTGHRSI